MIGWGSMLALALPSAACATGGITAVLSPTVIGTLRIERESGQSVLLQPTACRSGDHGHFLGADLQDPASSTLIRVVIDPLSGPLVKLLIGGGEQRSSFLLDGLGCASFGATVEDSGWRINDFRAVVGELEVDCPLPGDGRVKGKLTFRQCH